MQLKIQFWSSFETEQLIEDSYIPLMPLRIIMLFKTSDLTSQFVNIFVIFSFQITNLLIQIFYTGQDKTNTNIKHAHSSEQYEEKNRILNATLRNIKNKFKVKKQLINKIVMFTFKYLQIRN